MKKFLAVIVAVFTMLAVPVFADEAVLFDYSVKADVLDTGYDWVANAKTEAISGWYVAGKNITNPVLTEKYGLAVRTDVAPNGDSNYAISFITPNFNEPNSGAGYIKNAAAVKSMDITLTLNRGYDEVTVYWMQNGIEHKRKFTAKDAKNAIESMIEFEAHIDFGEYIEDVRNRSVKQIPVAGLNMTNIYLTKIQVTTHGANADWMFSPTSIVGIKKISMVYDKAVTEEAYERGHEADDIFGVNASKILEDKTRRKIESDLRMVDYNKSLMATEGTQSSSSNTGDAK